MVRIQRVILALGVFFLVGCAEENIPQEPEPAVKQEIKSGFLKTDQLEQLMSEGNSIAYFDVRKPELYKQGHIPGAIQVYRPDIQRDDLPYPGVAISKDTFQNLLDSLGLQSDDWIIAYDDKGGSDAARFCWLARRYGHQKAGVLDGGYNYFVTTNTPDTLWTLRPRSGYRFPDWELPDYVATVEDVLEAMNDSTTLLLDTRSFDEYSGKFMKPGASRAGHIPGSIWYDWGNSVRMDSDYLIKDVKDLEHMLGELNITKEHKIITYCHTGVRSSHTMTVLRDILGYPNVRNYDGSWCEWSYMKELPIAVVESDS